eukprot:scaffold504122_cov27-Prasinocladus_malaysianus.AAC.1
MNWPGTLALGDCTYELLEVIDTVCSLTRMMGKLVKQKLSRAYAARERTLPAGCRSRTKLTIKLN